MNLIFTICCGQEYRQIAEVSVPTFYNYAKKIKCDFSCSKHNGKSWAHIIENKFLIKKLLNKYDRVAFFDIDCIINPKAPNIFETHNDPETFYVRKRETNKEHFQVNTGVMIASKPHAHLFQKDDHKLKNHPLFKTTKLDGQSKTEQWLCCQLNDAKFPVKHLERMWHEADPGHPYWVFHAGGNGYHSKNKKHILQQRLKNKNFVSYL